MTTAASVKGRRQLAMAFLFFPTDIHGFSTSTTTPASSDFIFASSPAVANTGGDLSTAGMILSIDAKVSTMVSMITKMQNGETVVGENSAPTFDAVSFSIRFRGSANLIVPGKMEVGYERGSVLIFLPYQCAAEGDSRRPLGPSASTVSHSRSVCLVVCCI